MYRVRALTTLTYLTPMIVGVGLISLYPILYNVYISVTNQNLYHFRHYSFIGLTNYQSLLKTFDADFFIVLFRTFLFVAICIPLFLALGMLTALALNHPAIRFKAFWRVVLIVLWAVPSYITALVWKFFFNGEFGTFNQLYRLVAGPHASLPRLSDPNWAFASIVPPNLGMSYPLLMGGLLRRPSSHPAHLIESAPVRGPTPGAHS